MMGAPRKHPPQGAAETIQRLAATGFAIIGIARELKVSKETFKRWLDESESLQEAFDAGREIERQALHASVYRSAMEGKPANVNAFFLLKARHGYIEADNRSASVNVDVKVASVLVVKDHGTDEEWAAKGAEQQRRLLLDAENSLALPKPAEPQALTLHEQPSVAVPIAREWAPSQPSVSLDASVSLAPPAPYNAPVWKSNA
jgi:hypothetical protein